MTNEFELVFPPKILGPWRSRATFSGTEKWSNCPGSIAAESALKEIPKPDSDKGKKRHLEVHKILTGEVELTEETDKHVRTCVEHVRLITSGMTGKFGFEERLNLLGSSGGIDTYFVPDEGNVGFIIDFKFGVRFAVYAPGNLQLAAYACCLKEKFPHLTKIQVWVIQPTIEGEFEGVPSVTSWTLPHQTLRAYRQKLSDWLDEVDRASFIHAGDHCQFCKAKAGCPAHLSWAMATENLYLENPEESLPAVINGEWLPTAIPIVARILRMKERMTTWFNKAEDFLLAAGLSGQEEILRENGFETYQKRANRRWKGEADFMTEEDIAAKLRERGIKDPFKPKELINLTAAEAEVDIDDLVYKPTGGIGVRTIKEPKQKVIKPPKAPKKKELPASSK